MADISNIVEVEGVRSLRNPETGETRPLVKSVRELIAELSARLDAAEAEIAALKSGKV